MSQRDQEISVDYTNWDRLPGTATEIRDYLRRLLIEAGVTPHDVSARPKSIKSFIRKCRAKNYKDPIVQVTDSVAVRIITYSKTDLERTAELIRDRLLINEGEDRNPGDEKGPDRRGYDCRHIVVSGERPDAESGWLISRGALSRYFTTFGGLEIQLRTVAAHAWAEFEHARRYKGAQYAAIGDHDKATIDQLFGAAFDARRALDETFVAIDRLLANPTAAADSPPPETLGVRSPEADDDDTRFTPMGEQELAAFLANRFPDDEEGSEAGLAFACELVQACDLGSIESLEEALEGTDSDSIRSLMDASTRVTRVRRLDDELLARFGESYVERTGTIGIVKSRAKQLEWRFDRLRGKTGYSAYSLDGSACPDELHARLFPAARTVREVARIVAYNAVGAPLRIPDAVSPMEDLPPSARAKRVPLPDGGAVWVTTNLNREYAEVLMREILERSGGLDLTVRRDGELIATGGAGPGR